MGKNKTVINRRAEFESAIRKALDGHYIAHEPHPYYSNMLKVDGRFLVNIYDENFYVDGKMMDLEGLVDMVEERPAKNAEVRFDNDTIAVLSAKHPKLQELAQQPRITVRPHYAPLDSVNPMYRGFDGPLILMRPSGIIYLHALLPDLLGAVRYMNKTFKKAAQALPCHIPTYDEMPKRGWRGGDFDPLTPRAQRDTN